MTGRDAHLGELAAALVDGALDGGTRDEALAHLAGCSECRMEVEGQRRLKERLRRLPDPESSGALGDRLRALGTPVEAGSGRLVSPPGPGIRLSSPAPVGGLATPARRPVGAPGPARDRRRSGRRRAHRVAGVLTVVALGFAVALSLTPDPGQPPAISPPVARYTVEHARTTGGFPGADPGAGAVTVSLNR